MVLPPKKGSPPPELKQGKLAKEISTARNEKCLEKPDGNDEPVASQDPNGVETSGASSGIAKIPHEDANFPQQLPQPFSLVQTIDGQSYVVDRRKGNPNALAIRSRAFRKLLRAMLRKRGFVLRVKEINELIEEYIAQAETDGEIKDVSYRVARIDGGIEIDIGDEENTRIRVTVNGVTIVRDGSETLFHRTPVSQPLPMPAEKGNLDLLKKYLNVNETQIPLIIAWITYTLAHPKTSTSSYVILVVQGDQGSGKSFLCVQILSNLIDPNSVGIQIMPNNVKDLAIAGQNSHVLYYDNVRKFNHSMADILSIASTGGVLSQRQLYTDDEQKLFSVHVAIVLNGIHDFIDQPDLAQRCLPIRLKTMQESDRQSETELVQALQEDLPAIFRGLLDLIADIFKHLPTAEVTMPERMIDFVHWLAAMEKAFGAPTGVYQMEYSDALQRVQLDTLLDNPLAAAVYQMAEGLDGIDWSGTPADLLTKLEQGVTKGTKYSYEWPRNPIALSKRLISLQASLRSQGVDVQLGRGKHRRITITKTEGYCNE